MLAEAFDKLKAMVVDGQSLQAIPEGHKTIWMHGPDTALITEHRDSKRKVYFRSLPTFATAVSEAGSEESEVIRGPHGWECELESSILTYELNTTSQIAFWSNDQKLDHKQFVLQCRRFGGISAADLNALQTLNARATSTAEFKQGRDKGVQEFVVEQTSEMIPDRLSVLVRPFQELNAVVELEVQLIVHPHPVQIETFCRDFHYRDAIVEALEASAQRLRNYLEELKCKTPVYC